MSTPITAVSLNSGIGGGESFTTGDVSAAQTATESPAWTVLANQSGEPEGQGGSLATQLSPDSGGTAAASTWDGSAIDPWYAIGFELRACC
jgi:hypothetical protein